MGDCRQAPQNRTFMADGRASKRQRPRVGRHSPPPSKAHVPRRRLRRPPGNATSQQDRHRRPTWCEGMIKERSCCRNLVGRERVVRPTRCADRIIGCIGCFRRRRVAAIYRDHRDQSHLHLRPSPPPPTESGIDCRWLLLGLRRCGCAAQRACSARQQTSRPCLSEPSGSIRHQLWRESRWCRLAKR